MRKIRNRPALATESRTTHDLHAVVKGARSMRHSPSSGVRSILHRWLSGLT